MDITLTSRQEQIVLATILGDGSLWRGNAGNYQFRTNCSDKDKDYIFWKYGELCQSGMFLNPPKKRTNNLGKDFWYVYSRRNPFFTGLHRLFYPKNVKVLPLEVLSKLSRLGLAVWYMDDGNLHYRRPDPYGEEIPRIYLHTESFTGEDVHLACKVLNEEFGLRFTPKLNYGDRWRLSLGSNAGVHDFLDIVRPFIVPCMSRKITVK